MSAIRSGAVLLACWLALSCSSGFRPVDPDFASADGPARDERVDRAVDRPASGWTLVYEDSQTGAKPGPAVARGL